MRRIIGFFALLLLLAGGAVVPAHASSVTVYDYNYLITIPSLDGGQSTQVNLQWIGAPLNGQGIGGGGSAWVTGSPQSGYVNNLMAWTAALDNGVWDSEIFVQFADNANNDLAFWFIEPDSFWATVGTDLQFPAGNTVNNALLKWPNGSDPTTMQWGDSAVGAYYGDPSPCNGCTVDITRTAEVSPVPEPATILLLGSGVAGMVRMIRRKKARG